MTESSLGNKEPSFSEWDFSKIGKNFYLVILAPESKYIGNFFVRGTDENLANRKLIIEVTDIYFLNSFTVAVF